MLLVVEAGVYPGIHEAPLRVVCPVCVYDDDDLGKRWRDRTEEGNKSELMRNKQFWTILSYQLWQSNCIFHKDLLCSGSLDYACCR